MLSSKINDKTNLGYHRQTSWNWKFLKTRLGLSFGNPRVPDQISIRSVVGIGNWRTKRCTSMWSWNTPKAIYTVILLVSFQLPAISRTCFISSLFSSRLVHRPSAPQSTDWLSTLSNRYVPALVSSLVVSDCYPAPAELIHSILSYFDHLWNYLWIERNLNLIVN